MTVSAGIHRFDAGQRGRFRAAVADPDPGDDPGAVLARILLDLGLAGLEPDPAGEMRGRPRGVPADHPRIALLRRRGLQVVRTWPVGRWLATPEPLERVRTAWRSAAPLTAWLDAHVGPAAPRPPGRAEE